MSETYRIELSEKGYMTRIFRNGEELKRVSFAKVEIDLDKRTVLHLRIFPDSVELVADERVKVAYEMVAP